MIDLTKSLDQRWYSENSFFLKLKPTMIEWWIHSFGYFLSTSVFELSSILCMRMLRTSSSNCGVNLPDALVRHHYSLINSSGSKFPLRFYAWFFWCVILFCRGDNGRGERRWQKKGVQWGFSLIFFYFRRRTRANWGGQRPLSGTSGMFGGGCGAWSLGLWNLTCNATRWERNSDSFSYIRFPY